MLDKSGKTLRNFIFLAAVNLTACIVAFGAESTDSINILILSSYTSDAPSFQQLQSGLTQRFDNSETDVEIFHEFFDSARIPETDIDEALSNFLNTKYQSIALDLIFVWGPRAISLIESDISILPDIQKVYLDANNTLSVGINADIDQLSVFWAEENFMASFREIERLLAPQHYYIIAGSPNPLIEESLEFPAMETARQAVIPDKEVTYLLDESREVIDATLQAAPESSVVYFMLMYNDGHGQPMLPYQVTRSLAQSSPVPIFSMWDTHLGSGTVGGALQSFTVTGNSLAQSILADDFSQPLFNIRYAYDWEELQKWDIPISRLPDNAEIINQPTNAIYQYRYQIGAISVVILLLTFLSLSLSRTVVSRNRALDIILDQQNTLETRVKERTQELADKNLELEELLEEVKNLEGIIPICAYCKKIRDDEGFWNQVEQFISRKTDARFSHGICPECIPIIEKEIMDEGSANE